MASRYTEFYGRFWEEAKRLRWSDEVTFLAFYLQTCRHRNTEGLYPLPLVVVAHERRWEVDDVSARLDQLVADDFVRYDESTDVVFLVEALRDPAPPRGERQIKGAYNRLSVCAETLLRVDFLAAARTYAPDLAEYLDAQPEWDEDRIRKHCDTPSGNPIRRGIPPARGTQLNPNPDSTTSVEPSRLDVERDARARERRERQRERSRQVRTIFDTWVEVTHRTGRTDFSAKRRRVIERALDVYPFEDVLDAVKGWRNFAHNRGENDRGRPFNDLELLLRDAEHIERFRDAERGARSQRATVPRRFLTAAEMQAAEAALRAQERDAA